MAKTIDLYIDQGVDFSAIMPPLTLPNGTVQSLVDYTFLAYIRRSYATIFAVQMVATALTPVTQGIIMLSLGPGETAGLAPTRYVYDVVIEDILGIKTKVFEGLAIVNPGVSSKPKTTLISPYVPEDYGGL